MKAISKNENKHRNETNNEMKMAKMAHGIASSAIEMAAMKMA